MCLSAYMKIFKTDHDKNTFTFVMCKTPAKDEVQCFASIVLLLVTKKHFRQKRWDDEDRNRTPKSGR